MQQQTPIRKAIDILECRKKNSVHPDYEYGIETAIEILKELLPTEKEVIEKAFSEGFISSASPEAYFKSEYTQNI